MYGNTINNLNSLEKEKSLEDQNIRESAYLEITKETISIGQKVYQVSNVTGFGVSRMKKVRVPWTLTIMLLLIGIICFSIQGGTGNSALGSIGFLFTITSIAAIAYNFIPSNKFGLAMYLNSGKTELVISEDVAFLKRVVKELKGFIESPDKSQVINVKVGQDVKGDLVIGNKSTTVNDMPMNFSGNSQDYQKDNLF